MNPDIQQIQIINEFGNKIELNSLTAKSVLAREKLIATYSISR